jgi:monofunctional glycosyltransferase
VARSRGRLRALGIAWKAFTYTLGVLVIAFVLAQAWFFAHILYWGEFPPSSTTFMEQRREALQEKTPRVRIEHRWVPYERISTSLKRAVVAAEDARFLDHEGFDWEMIQKAMAKNERRGRIVAGASTISQQLAKNLFLSGERSWLRKGEEAIITWMLETTLSKRRILELYLNVAEWGEGVFGAEAAARHHFGVSAAALSPEQAAWLAVILPTPRRYERGRLTSYLAGRVETILARMPAAQIPPSEAPPSARPRSEPR